MRFLPSALRFAVPSLALCLSVLPAPCQGNSPASKDAQASLAPAKIQHIQNGIQLTTGDLNVKVQFYAEGIVRVVKWPTGGKPDKVSLSVVQKDLPQLDLRF